MRTRWAAVATVTALGLACGGFGEVAVPEAPDGPAPPEVPEPSEAPEGGNVTPIDPGDATAVLWLADAKGRCALRRRDLASGDTTVLAKLDGPCPEPWRIAIPPGNDVDHVVIYSTDHAWVVTREGATDLGPTPDGIDFLTNDGPPVACGEPDAKAVEDGQGHYSWTLDGKSYELETEMGAILVRTFVHEAPDGWKAVNVVPTPLFEGMQPPFCRYAPGFDSQSFDLSPAVPTLESAFREATEDEAAALQSLGEGGWHLSKDGGIAARTEWFEGVMFVYPVVSRTSASAPWKPVPELTGDDGATAHYDASGPWLLINQPSGSLLRDVRTGEVAWTAPEAAVFLRERVVLPAFQAGEDAAPDEDAPAPKPAGGGGGGGDHHKAKGKAKAKAKAKAH